MASATRAGGPIGRLAGADQLRNPNGHLMSEIGEANIKSWSEQFSKMPNIDQMQGPRQWRNLKGEITRLSSLGFVPAARKPMEECALRCS
jgi:hypothetical protein